VKLVKIVRYLSQLGLHNEAAGNIAVCLCKCSRANLCLWLWTFG